MMHGECRVCNLLSQFFFQIQTTSVNYSYNEKCNFPVKDIDGLYNRKRTLYFFLTEVMEG